MDWILFELFRQLESSLEIVAIGDRMYSTASSKFSNFSLSMACSIGSTFAQIRPPAVEFSRASYSHVVYWEFRLYQNIRMLSTIRIRLCSTESWNHLGQCIPCCCSGSFPHWVSFYFRWLNITLSR